MKVTNFEISKKLAEIGFEAETDFFWSRPTIKLIGGEEFVGEWNLSFVQDKNFISEKWIRSFDLETLLDALPSEVELIESHFSKKRGFYLDLEVFGREFFIEKEENESLADTAARLLMLLAEKGIINFEKQEGK
jgi:hypothetical protein